MTESTNVQNEWVTRVLGVAVPQGQPVSGGFNSNGAVVRLAKGMILWNQTRSFVAQEVKRLQAAILADAEHEADYDDIADNIGSLEDVLEILDDRLTDKLNALRGTTDAAEKQKLADEARDLVLHYRSQVETDPLMNGIDHNGFVELGIKAKVESTLDAVMRTI